MINKFKSSMKNEASPSKKYRGQLKGIKKNLMREIASYFKDGKFNMNSQCTIYYPMEFGSSFAAIFNTVAGDENNIRLKTEGNIATIIGFEADGHSDESLCADVYFLSRLLDYMWLDMKERERKANMHYV